MEVPTLETERLKLRGHRLEDLAACAAMWADPEVIRYTTRKPQTEEEAAAGRASGRKLPTPEVLQPSLDASLPQLHGREIRTRITTAAAP